ncbi:MAG: GGDEF domain-containing protein [Pseudomonadota bacterium]
MNWLPRRGLRAFVRRVPRLLMNPREEPGLEKVEEPWFGLSNALFLCGAVFRLFLAWSWALAGLIPAAGLGLLGAGVNGFCLHLNIKRPARGRAIFLALLEAFFFMTLVFLLLGWTPGFLVPALSVPALTYSWPGKTFRFRLTAILVEVLGLSVFFATADGGAWSGPIGRVDVIGCLGAAALLLVYFEAARRREKARREELKTTDVSTGVLNRQGILEIIEAERERFALEGRPFILAVAGIDDFRFINESYGLQGGDFALTAAARMLRAGLRKTDRLARWGGAGFLLFLPGTSLAEGRKTAERLQADIASRSSFWKGWEIRFTLTFGLAVHDRRTELDVLVREAETAFDAARARGKNQVGESVSAEGMRTVE